MLVFDRESWKKHRAWCIEMVVATLGALAWYVAYGLIPFASASSSDLGR
jgi:hypothetical protein